MVAAVCAWHEHHLRAVAELGRRLARREPLLVAAPALVETYAVLTRLPPPHRLAAADALAVLEGSFVEIGRVVALDADAYRAVLGDAPRGGVTGGRTYDAVIAACGRLARATTILTFNVSHFRPFATPDLQIVLPGEPPT